MSDSIREIASTLNPDEIHEFKRFIKQSRDRGNGKVILLLEVLLGEEELSKKELSLRLYPNGNTVAYQALRKRLTRMLNRFIALKLMDHDSSNTSQVLSLVNMSRYLYSHHLPHQGWKYLRKAERAALNNDLFEILNTVYVMQIQQMPADSKEFNQEEIIERWKENKKRLVKNEQGEIALSIISKKILSAHSSGKYESIDSLIRNTLKELNFSEDYLLQPRFVYHISSVNRKRLSLEKDYFSLEPFLINQYNAIKDQSGFQSKHNYYKLGFLYMICHTLYRNKKFSQALGYHEQLERELQTAPKVLINEFGPKARLLGASLLLFKREIENSLRLLEQGLQSENWTLSQKLRLNFIVNIGIVQFYQKKYSDANKTLRLINHSDKWCEKIMGAEWVMKKNLMEVLLYFELSEFSLVDSRINYLLRSFRKLLQAPKYARVKTYLKLLRKLAAAPDQGSIEDLAGKVETSFEWISIAQEDLQAMAFYAWLKAKLLQRGHYDVLLEIAGEVEASTQS